MEHVAGRQTRDRPNVVRAQQGAVQQPALEVEQVQLPGRVTERLGRHGGVAVHERERRGPYQHRLERLRAGLVGGPLGERVLHDPEPSVGLAQLDPQIGDLIHRDTAVVDREDRLGCADLLRDLVYDC